MPKICGAIAPVAPLLRRSWSGSANFIFAYIFLTMGAYPSIYVVDLEKLELLEHPKQPR